jgi:hypothetical protein
MHENHDSVVNFIRILPCRRQFLFDRGTIQCTCYILRLILKKNHFVSFFGIMFTYDKGFLASFDKTCQPACSMRLYVFLCVIFCLRLDPT